MSQSKKHDPIQGEIVHEYDGIQEADNRLPTWWLMTFYGAVVFAIGYWFYYQEFGVGPSLLQEYFTESAAAAEKNGVDPTEAELSALTSGATLELGRGIFQSNCVACHEAKGQGKIGPNLTDSAWLHGGEPLAIFKTVREGVPQKGMPAWGPTLGRAGVSQVVAFVMSIRDTNVPGKAAEGQPASALLPAAPDPAASNTP